MSMPLPDLVESKKAKRALPPTLQHVETLEKEIEELKRELAKYKGENDGELTENESGYILDTCLKPKHRKDERMIAFIEAFVRCKSIPQASAEVGIAKGIGYSWRHRKDVANCIQKLIDKSVIKYGFDSSEIFERVKEAVEFDPIAMQNPDGTFKSNMWDIEPEARRCIKKLKVRDLWQRKEDINGIKQKIIVGEVIEYEFYDKIKAAELVGKEKEMFKNTTKVEHTITKDMESILLESAQRGQKRIENAIEVDYKEVE